MIEKIIDNFNIEGEVINVEENNSGNINSTYIVTIKNKDNKKKKYLVQRINTNVFQEPYKLMKNIEDITNYLDIQMQKEGDTTHKVLRVIKTKNNKLLCYIEVHPGERRYYRVYEYIDNAISYDNSIDEKIVYNTGKAFGNFQRLLSNYPIRRLTETIKDFHITDKRFKQLMDDIKVDSEGRALEVAPEIVFILMREEICSLITEQLGTDAIPLRVTHNDTKVNNVMMNKKTGDYLAVIDLDTVMPGSLLFDYGDGVRSTAASAKEDETDLSKVSLDLKLFEAYTKGFLSEVSNNITYEELSLMAESIRIITLELAIRFLNDYINGDTYFKINYEKHNLDRARNQIALVKDIENKMEYIKHFIKECYDEFHKHNK